MKKRKIEKKKKNLITKNVSMSEIKYDDINFLQIQKKNLILNDLRKEVLSL